jgi:putative ABC transport system permease protein
VILFLKAVRTIWRGKRSYIACIALMALGVMVYICMNMLHVNLDLALRAMYIEERFAEGFARVEQMPLSAVAFLEREQGIDRMQGNLVADARVQGIGNPGEIITLRLNSFDPTEPYPLNDFALMSGARPSEGEIVIGKPFFDANELSLGGEITVILGGREQSFVISGTALSPEYVYSIPDASQLMPDDRTFGVAFLPYRQLAGLMGMHGSANNLAFTLLPGFEFEQVRPRLEDALMPYGTRYLIGREDHPSHSMLRLEIDTIGDMSGSLSMVFVFMAVIILYIMLGRVIQQERMQIGALKAFGFSNRAIIGHYLCYGGTIGIVGGALGVFLGLWAANSMTELFLVYFHLPSLDGTIRPAIPVTGFVIAVVSGVLASFMGTRKILNMLPCEAMRPSAPKAVKTDIIRKLGPLRHALSSTGQMAVRNLTRSRFRSLFVIMGLAFSYSLIAIMGGVDHMFDAMLTDQFNKVQVFDLKIVLNRPQSFAAVTETAWRLEGATHAEAILEIPAELRNGHLSRGVVVTALPAGSELYRIYDSMTGLNHEPPTQGFIVSESLANRLEVQRGDMVTIKTPHTGGREIAVPVVGVVSGNIGMTCYMELGALCRLLDIPATANAIILNSPQVDALKEELVEGENVMALIDAIAAKQIYTDLMQQYMALIYMMLISACGVAFAIISNTSSISLSERSREYSTLRVLGMSPREIGRIIAFEHRVLTVIGIALGIPLTTALKEAVYGSMDTDMFSVPTDTPFATFLMAAAMCVLTVELCGLLSVRRISKFDMVEVLKERE